MPQQQGHKLRQIRAALGLTQAEMITRLQPALPDQSTTRRGSVSEFESGARDPGALILRRYVQIVNQRFGDGLISLEHLVDDQIELPPLAQSVGLRQEAISQADANPVEQTADREYHQQSFGSDLNLYGGTTNVFGKVFAQGANFCLFQKLLDKDAVYLELTGLEFEAKLGVVTVQIPLPVWETIRRICVVQLDLAEKTDSELRRLAEQAVDLRLLAYHSARQSAPPPSPAPVSAAPLEDDYIYGSASDERARQIERGVRFLRDKRGRQQRLRDLMIERLNQRAAATPELDASAEETVLAYVLGV